MSNENCVTIIMLTFFLEDVIFKTIDRLLEVTDHPYRLIVGDNLSIKSKEIRNRLKKYVDEGKIDKLYLFNDNFKGKAIPYIFNREPKTKFTIITDSDVYITKKDDPCWLTTFVNKLNDEDDLGAIAFHSLNSPTIITANGGSKSKIVVEAKKGYGKNFCYKEIDGRCHHNAHFYTFKTKILEKHNGGSDDRPFIDGAVMSWLKKNKIKSCRYDKTPVINISTVITGNDQEYSDLINLEQIQEYVKIRKINHDLTKAKKIKNNDYEIYEKKD